MINLPGIDPATNARFSDIGNGMYSEIMSDQLQLFYNPVTEECRGIFNCAKYLPINSTYIKIGEDMSVLEVDFSSVITQCFGAGLVDPVTNADLGTVSTAGIMLIVKKVLDLKWNERAAALAQAIADAQAAADAAAASTTTTTTP